MKDLVIVRGAGDLATGIVSKLHAVGWKVLALERHEPLAIRRHVCFSEAVWEGSQRVEGIQAYLANDREAIMACLRAGNPAVAVDPQGNLIPLLKPRAVIDATLTKKNITTKADMAPIVIGVGPGHVVGVHCHSAVESMRGHHLGRVYYEGTPIENTGIPGNIGGHDHKRVIRAPKAGRLSILKDITDQVEAGDIIAYVDDVPVVSHIKGVLRGMLRQGVQVTEGLKMADVDPRGHQVDNCYHISDKARCIAGGVLEALMTLDRQVGP